MLRQRVLTDRQIDERVILGQNPILQDAYIFFNISRYCFAYPRLENTSSRLSQNDPTLHFSRCQKPVFTFSRMFLIFFPSSVTPH